MQYDLASNNTMININLYLQKLINGCNNFRIRYPNISIFLVFLLFIIVFYHKVFWGYFEGDEWYYFSKFMPLTNNWYGIFQALYKSIFDAESISGGGHLTPVYNGLWFLYNQIAGVNYYPYIITSILLHSTNSFLVYNVTSKLISRRLVSIGAGLFFALSAAHFQAISWVMNFIPTQLSVTFFLLSLNEAIIYAKNYRVIHSHRSNISKILIFALLALWTKENTVILFVLIPMIIYMFNPKAFTKNFKLTFLIFVLGYGAFRALLPLLVKAITPNTISSQPVIIDYSLYLFRALTYPV